MVNQGVNSPEADRQAERPNTPASLSSEPARDIFFMATHEVSDQNNSHQGVKQSQLCAVESHATTSTSFVVDTGANRHLIRDISLFTELQMDKSHNSHTIRLANGTTDTGIVRGSGKASFKLHDNNGNVRRIILMDALFVPNFQHNIISVMAATRNGVAFKFCENGAMMEVPDGTSFNITPTNKLYELHCEQ